MDNGTYEALKDNVKRAAKSVALQWPGTIDADDAEQEIWLRLLESYGSVAKLLDEMDDRQRYGAVVRIGHQIASQYREDYDAFTGNYRYSVGEVRSLLNNDLLIEERKEIKPERLDAEEALAALNNTRYRDLIVLRYRFKESPNSRGDQDALERAVDALTDGMNRVYRNRRAEYIEGPGTRRVMSNAAAIARNGKHD